MSGFAHFGHCCQSSGSKFATASDLHSSNWKVFDGETRCNARRAPPQVRAKSMSAARCIQLINTVQWAELCIFWTSNCALRPSLLLLLGPTMYSCDPCIRLRSPRAIQSQRMGAVAWIREPDCQCVLYRLCQGTLCCRISVVSESPVWHDRPHWSPNNVRMCDPTLPRAYAKPSRTEHPRFLLGKEKKRSGS
jgi:hypothetical protein